MDIEKRITKKGPYLAVVEHKPIRVPLDGGLAKALGAAGIAYFIIRKKKKQSEI